MLTSYHKVLSKNQINHYKLLQVIYDEAQHAGHDAAD